MSGDRAMTTLKDWRGNEWGVGSVILYPRMSGRSCEIQEGTVERIWWVKTGFKTEGSRWGSWEVPEGTEEAVMRVRVRPNGRGSRDFCRTDRVARYRVKATGEILGWKDFYLSGHYKDSDSYEVVWNAIPLKPVTLTVTENITALIR